MANGQRVANHCSSHLKYLGQGAGSLTQVTEADVTQLMRPELRALEPYEPIHPFEVVSRRLGRSPEQIVKLDANENPYGPSSKAIEAIANYRWHHIYPDPQNTELREALADYLGVSADNVFVGHGADELIDLIDRLFLSPGDAIIDCPPTFGMYAFDAAINGARVISVPRREDFSLDVEEIERVALGRGQRLETARRRLKVRQRASSRPKLLFLCSPNNPDGRLVPAEVLERLLRLPLVIVVDEAYIEFAGQRASFVPWVAQHANLVVLRTFSKWAGLGGLRVGYGVMPTAIIQQLWKIKQPYNVNVAGTQAALASLADRQTLMSNVAKLIAERERLCQELAAFDFLEPVLGSRSNFVLCRVIGRDAYALKRALEQHGVLVRHFARPGLEDCLRISVGRPGDTDALVTALKMVG